MYRLFPLLLDVQRETTVIMFRPQFSEGRYFRVLLTSVKSDPHFQRDVAFVILILWVPKQTTTATATKTWHGETKDSMCKTMAVHVRFKNFVDF